MPILESKADQSVIRRILLAPLAGFIRNLLSRVPFPQPPRRPAIANPGEDGMEPVRRRLADEKSLLDRLDAERESRGDPGLGKVRENRIVWHELIELELQDIEEQVTRIRELGDGAADGRSPNLLASSVCTKEVLMSTTIHERLNLDNEEFVVLTELLESARTKLMVEVRHTDHRVFRDELRRRLTVVERLLDRCR
jgi:hypothetical protein